MKYKDMYEATERMETCRKYLDTQLDCIVKGVTVLIYDLLAYAEATDVVDKDAGDMLRAVATDCGLMGSLAAIRNAVKSV